MADTDDKTREAENGSPFGTCPKCNSPRMEAEPGSPFIGNSRILSALRRFSGRNNGDIMPPITNNDKNNYQEREDNMFNFKIIKAENAETSLSLQ